MTITIWPFSLFNTQSPQNHAAIPPTGNNGQVQQQGQAAAAAQNHHQNQPEPLVDLPHIAGHGGAGDDLGERGHSQPQHRANPAATERPARRRGAFSSETYTEEDVANYVKTVGKWEMEESFFCLGVQEAWLSSVFCFVLIFLGSCTQGSFDHGSPFQGDSEKCPVFAFGWCGEEVGQICDYATRHMFWLYHVSCRLIDWLI